MATKKTVRTKLAPAVRRSDSCPRLRVTSFGPIHDCELPIQDLIVLIGEQASGKSTLAKLVYFFQSVPAMVDEHAVQLASGPAFENWVKLLRQRFMESFGTTKHLPSFEIEYHYAHQIRLRLTQEKKTGHIRVEPDARLSRAVVERIELTLRSGAAGGGSASGGDPLRQPDGSGVGGDQDRARRALRKLTRCESERIFVPSARSLLSVLSADLLSTELPALDPLMRQFVRRISRLQRDFTRTLEDQVDLAIHASLRDVPVDQDAVRMAIRLVRSVLKGEYVHDRGKERIALDDGGEVYLRFASSGQQESLWILLLLFSIILHNTPTTVIMEEPEAHLFPFAQRDVVNLIALCMNMTPAPGAPPNTSVVTTHSPYVLSALNNLLYAWQVAARGAEAKKKAGALVDPHLWLSPEDTGVWFVGGGEIRSIMDPDLGLIQAEEIDGVSSALRCEFDALAELEGM